MKSTKPTVQVIKPTVKADDPPAEWRQNTDFGFMGFDSTPAGRLVRLADVLRWLGQYPSQKPHAAELNALCDAMPGDVMQWLYRVQTSDYAKPVPSDYMFSYLTPEEIAASKAKACQDNAQRMHEAQNGGRFPGLAIRSGKISPVEAKQAATQALYEPTEPGRPALLKRINSLWSNNAKALDHSGEYLNYLSIPLDKAAQHWGYGRGAEVVQLHSGPDQDADRSPEWTGEKLAAQQAVYKAEGHKDYAKRTWAFSGVKERDGRRLVSEFQSTLKAATAGSFVFEMGKRNAKKGVKRG